MENASKAFNYEDGQFVCHIHARIPEEIHQLLLDIVQVIENKQQQTPNATNAWVSVSNDNKNQAHEFHITLLRGHRAIYYHQIRPLIDSLRIACANLAPFSVCLDRLEIFQNHESTKQFLCLASRASNTQAISKLKQELDHIVKQFAIQLTSETETTDTVAHSSLMYRQMSCNDKDFDIQSTLQDMQKLCSDELGDVPICVVRIECIQVTIGNHTYNLHLQGSDCQS